VDDRYGIRVSLEQENRLTQSIKGVVLPVDAGATCATGSDVPKSASINPPK
jgi:hypothetical protein